MKAFLSQFSAVMKKMTTSDLFITVVLLISICLGSYFRLVNIPENIRFYGDEGIDLLIAQGIIDGTHFPLVGPILNVQNFFTPPTYYYLLAFFLWIGKSVTGVIYLFILVNILTVVLLTHIAKELWGKTAAFFASAIALVSVDMIYQSKSLWQPYFVPLLSLVVIYCLYLYDKRKHFIFILPGILAFFLAVSIYIPAILLLPFLVGKFIAIWIRHEKKIIQKVFVLLAVIIFSVASFFLFFSPQLRYEAAHGYPTYQAIFSEEENSPSQVDLAPSLRNSKIVQNTYQSFVSIYFLAFPPLLVSKWLDLSRYFHLSIFLLGILLFPKPRQNNTCGFFTKSDVLLLALGPILFSLFFDGVIYSHRFILFPLFLYLFFAKVLANLYSSKKRYGKYLALFTFFIYILANGLVSYSMFIAGKDVPTPFDREVSEPYLKAQEVAAAISKDVEAKNLPPNWVSVHLFTPEDISNWNLATVLFFLHRNSNFPVSYTEEGHDIVRPAVFNPSAPVTYLFCSNFSSKLAVDEGCLYSLLPEGRDEYSIERRILRSGTLFVIDKKIAE